MKFVKYIEPRKKLMLHELIRTSSSFKVRQRSHAVLLSSKKIKIEDLSQIFEVDRDTLSEWLKRWDSQGIDGLKDASRPGRPPRKRNEQIAINVLNEQ